MLVYVYSRRGWFPSRIVDALSNGPLVCGRVARILGPQGAGRSAALLFLLTAALIAANPRPAERGPKGLVGGQKLFVNWEDDTLDPPTTDSRCGAARVVATLPKLQPGLSLLWATPILRRQLVKQDSPLLATLRHAVLERYNSFKLTAVPEPTQTVNDRFFWAQTDSFAAGQSPWLATGPSASAYATLRVAWLDMVRSSSSRTMGQSHRHWAVGNRYGHVIRFVGTAWRTTLSHVRCTVSV